MTTICGDEIDYHTIKDGRDIYLCQGHDNAFEDAEGLNPLRCEHCGNHEMMIWKNDENSSYGEVLCENCDTIRIDELSGAEE